MITRKPPSLKQRVVRAGGWSLAGHIVMQVFRLGSNLAMTRLLVPEMFGVMAIATMVVVVLNMLADIGLRQNIVQSHRGDDPVFLDTAWAVQILRGIFLWGVALAISAALWIANQFERIPLQSVYAAPELPHVIAVSSLASVILGFQSTKVATSHRHFEQSRIVQIEITSQLFGVAIMIAAGLATRSIWALVAGGLVASIISTVLGHTWLPGHRNRLQWDGRALRELITFGKWAFVSSIFTVLAANGDRMILGGFVEADLLGMYAIASLFVGAVEGALGRIFGAVSLPALSEVARTDPAKLRHVYYRLRVPGDVVLLLMSGLFFASGQLIIDLLYDSRYSAAGRMLEVLALSLVAARYGVAYQIYLAVGMPRYMAIIQAVRCIALFALVPSLHYWGGVQAAIWGIALHGLAMIPLVHVFNHRLGLNDFRREAGVLAAFPVGYLVGTSVVRLVT